MELFNLERTQGSAKSKKRVARGRASGHGKTAGRGENGQNSRSGGGTRPGFEGGQMPLFRRVPKRGFNNVNRKEYEIVNLDFLNSFEGTEVTVEALIANGKCKGNKTGIKIVGNGTLSKALNVKVNKFTTSAKEAIIAAGGSVEEV